nr:MAG TPA: hypothetical protein [Caudoviricetes sp.]
MGNSFLFFWNFKALMLEEAFLIFRELGVLTRRVLGLIYTPSRYPCRTLPGKPAAPWVPASLA